jgi:hypothetical protein
MLDIITALTSRSHAKTLERLKASPKLRAQYSSDLSLTGAVVVEVSDGDLEDILLSPRGTLPNVHIGFVWVSLPLIPL